MLGQGTNLNRALLLSPQTFSDFRLTSDAMPTSKVLGCRSRTVI